MELRHLRYFVAVAEAENRLSYFRQLAFILGAVSLVVGFLLVTTLVTVSVNERAGEIAGARRDEYAAAIKDAGMTRQAVWHQQTPRGDNLSIVYIEATDPDAPQRFTSSDAEISRWFVERMQEAYGRDVTLPPLPVELTHDVLGNSESAKFEIRKNFEARIPKATERESDNSFALRRLTIVAA